MILAAPKTMPEHICLVDAAPDTLWRHSVTQDGLDECSTAQVLLFDLGQSRMQGLPYRWNGLGWRDWLSRRADARLHWVNPTGEGVVAAWAAKSLGRSVTVHFTEAHALPDRAFMRLIAPTADTFVCGSQDQKAILLHSRRVTDPIRIHIPHQAATPIHDDPSEHPGPVLAALPRLCNRAALKQVIWAAGILKHTISTTRLLVTGPASIADRAWLKHWSHVWQLEDMIEIVDEEFGCCIARADWVLAVTCRPTQPARLRVAQQLHKTILLPPAYTLPHDYSSAGIVRMEGELPRFFAAHIVRGMT